MFDGGHGSGSNLVGYNEIIPDNPHAPYLSYIVRYGENSTGSFDFAFPLYSQTGYDDTWVNVSSGGNGQNWLEIQNVLDEPNSVSLYLYANDGEEAHSELISLAAREARHIDASLYITNGRSGSAYIYSNSPNSFIAQSMFYFRNNFGSITTMYGTQAGETIGGARSGTWNLFLGMYNWLRLFNTDAIEQDTLLTIYNGANIVSQNLIPLQPLSGIDIPLHDTSTYGTQTNSYGQLTIENDHIMGQLLRIHPATDALTFDYVFPTGTRR